MTSANTEGNPRYSLPVVVTRLALRSLGRLIEDSRRDGAVRAILGFLSAASFLIFVRSISAAITQSTFCSLLVGEGNTFAFIQGKKLHILGLKRKFLVYEQHSSFYFPLTWSFAVCLRACRSIKELRCLVFFHR